MANKGAKGSVDREMARLAGEQKGCISHAQLAALGLSRSAVHARVEAGRLHPRHRGVYAVGHPVLTVAGKRRAALLAHGAGAVLAHATAADHHGLRPSGSPLIHVLIAGDSGRKRQPGIRLHRTRFLPESERTEDDDGLAITTWPRTVLDMAATLRETEDIRVMLDRAIHLCLFDLTALAAVLDAHPSRPGRARLAKVLERDKPTNLTRGKLEQLFLAFCDRHGLPRPLVNHPIALSGHETATVDFCWPAQRVIVETDDRRTHLSPPAFENDRRRDAILASKGWIVLRYTFARLRDEPEAVATELRTLLIS
jgi:hypothetical protein